MRGIHRSPARPVARSFDVFFDLCLNKRLNKQFWGWWMIRHRAHCDVTVMIYLDMSSQNFIAYNNFEIFEQYCYNVTLPGVITNTTWCHYEFCNHVLPLIITIRRTLPNIINTITAPVSCWVLRKPYDLSRDSRIKATMLDYIWTLMVLGGKWNGSDSMGYIKCYHLARCKPPWLFMVIIVSLINISIEIVLTTYIDKERERMPCNN